RMGMERIDESHLDRRLENRTRARDELIRHLEQGWDDDVWITIKRGQIREASIDLARKKLQDRVHRDEYIIRSPRGIYACLRRVPSVVVCIDTQQFAVLGEQRTARAT